MSALNAPLTLLIGARAAILERRPDQARELLRMLGETGVRGPTLDAEREMVAAGIEALEGRWAEATVAYDRAIRRLGELGLDLDVGIAWLSAMTVAPPDEPVVDAEREARALFERLVPGGTLAVFVPIEEPDYIMFHRRNYSLQSIAERVEQAGFVLRRVEGSMYVNGHIWKLLTIPSRRRWPSRR